MASLASIIQFCDDLLIPARFHDYCPNGLQVCGKAEIQRIALGVSCSLEFFEVAAAGHADLLLTHHGLFWNRDPRVIGPILRVRLKALLDHDLALVAYHLPLDANPDVGNNAELVRLLGFGPARIGFGPLDGNLLGAIGDSTTPIGRDEFVERVRSLGSYPLVLPSGSETVRRIGVVSGSGASYLVDAAERGCDLFLTGEADEPTPAMSRELGINVVAMGHYNSEKFGVMALGQRLATTFGVEVLFVDVPNPV